MYEVCKQGQWKKKLIIPTTRRRRTRRTRFLAFQRKAKILQMIFCRILLSEDNTGQEHYVEGCGLGLWNGQWIHLWQIHGQDFRHWVRNNRRHMLRQPRWKQDRCWEIGPTGRHWMGPQSKQVDSTQICLNIFLTDPSPGKALGQTVGHFTI